MVSKVVEVVRGVVRRAWRADKRPPNEDVEVMVNVDVDWTDATCYVPLLLLTSCARFACTGTYQDTDREDRRGVLRAS